MTPPTELLTRKEALAYLTPGRHRQDFRRTELDRYIESQTREAR